MKLEVKGAHLSCIVSVGKYREHNLADQYAREWIKRCTAQIIRKKGFELVSSRAMNVMTDLTTKYIEALASKAHEFAEHADRTDSNAIDVLLALQSMGMSAEDLLAYVDTQEEIPFEWKVVPFPAQKKSKGMEASFKAKDILPPDYIPDFLPSFPKEFTYKETEQTTEQEADPHKDWVTIQKQKQDGEAALLNLQNRLKESGQAGPTAVQTSPAVHGANNKGNKSNTWDEGEDVTTFIPEPFAKMLKEKRGRGISNSMPSNFQSEMLPEQELSQVKDVFLASGSTYDLSKLSSRPQAPKPRLKLKSFKFGGWKPDGEDEVVELDLMQREKIDRAERILRLGVNASEEDTLL